MTINTPTNENTFQVPENPTIYFQFQGSTEPVLTLTKEGFTYLGETITDGGRAYDLWTEAMKKVIYG